MAKATSRRRDTDLERLLDQAPAKEAGVAEAIRLYEACEGVYVAASLASSGQPLTQSATAANLPPKRS